MGKEKEAQSFKIEYNEVVKELITNASIKPPRILARDDDSFTVKVKAVWDTGATNTVITHEIASRLGLKPTGKAVVFGVNSKAVVNRYFIDIELPGGIELTNFEVTESELNSEEIDLLVGMDIIQRGDFVISNAAGKTTFYFCTPPLDVSVEFLKKVKT